jgi:hypothetical protein
MDVLELLHQASCPAFLTAITAIVCRVGVKG